MGERDEAWSLRENPHLSLLYGRHTTYLFYSTDFRHMDVTQL